MRKLGLLTILILAISAFANAQSTENLEAAIKDSPAYGMVLLRKANVQIKLNKLSARFTESHPDYKMAVSELSLLNAALEKISSQKSANKLTPELGRAILQKFEIESKLQTLKSALTDNHPQVTDLTKELYILNSALNEILN